MKRFSEHIVESVVNPLIKLFYPDECRNCGGILSFGEVILCDSCFSKFEFQPKYEEDATISGCQFSYIFSLGIHNGILQEYVHRMKYEGVQSIPKRLITRADEIGILPSKFLREKTLIPVPLHPAKVRERGFNQAEILAQALSSRLECDVLNALKRIRYTLPMVELSPEERKRNVKGAFAMRNCNVQGEVVIVDDVLTTGSTVAECARILKEAGCDVVGIFTLTRAN